MTINWNNIGAVDGQREGFEELVCQLAAREKIPNQREFVRIGKPDGGKECYWELQNGTVHCWQAKYFINSLSDNQWARVCSIKCVKVKSIKLNNFDHGETTIKKAREENAFGRDYS